MNYSWKKVFRYVKIYGAIGPHERSLKLGTSEEREKIAVSPRENTPIQLKPGWFLGIFAVQFLLEKF
ncbi:hypothetical protein Pfo_020638 [Paulownia fortunei]|nr:hypothetical protein Pfo_020638 [Paulownia fortunei]